MWSFFTYQIIPDCAQVQAELSDVLETKLVANGSIDAEQLDKAVLGCPEAILNFVAATTLFTSPKKLIVHALQSGFVQIWVLTPHNERTKRVETKDDRV